MEDLEQIFKLFLAFILGGIIGLEREKINKPAGFRTHIIVTMGACLTMIISFEISKKMNLQIDPTRIGAQVISGIGFLGAGTILKSGDNVKGLTTAATLWGVACLGLAIGAGLYVISIATVALFMLTLIVVSKIDILYTIKKSSIEIRFKLEKDADVMAILSDIMKNYKIQIKKMRVDEDAEEGEKLVTMILGINSMEDRKLIIDEIEKLDDIYLFSK